MNLIFNDSEFLNPKNLDEIISEWTNSEPFDHVCIDNFFNEQTIKSIVSEFPNFQDPVWRVYKNPIENKKVLNYWDKFGPTTYKFFQYLNSNTFISNLERFTGFNLFPDFGLNGGGLHTHGNGGKNNVHLDYSLHPKLGLERKLNLIVYISPFWDEAWGGSLGLYTQKEGERAPDILVKKITPQFNRAIIFNTTQNSWHGLPDPINCPEDKYRNSLATYFLSTPNKGVEERYKALFAPHGDQRSNPEILDLIEKRSRLSTASEVYGDKF